MDGQRKISTNKLFAAGIAVLLLLLLLALTLTAVSLRRNAKGIDDYRAETVARVGRTSIPRYLFEFFCLEAAKEEFSVNENGHARSVPSAEDIRTAALRYTKEYISLLREAEKAGVTLTAAEERRVDEDIFDLFGSRDRDGTILAYYGLYESEYRAIRLNFVKIDKFLDACAESAEPSEDYLQKVYDRNIDLLGGGTGEIIYMNTATLDEASAKLRRDTLSRICDSVNAVAAEEKSAVMQSMFEMYNEPGFINGNMTVTVGSGVAAEYPGLFEAFCRGETGVCYGIEERDALFAVLITGRNGLDSVRDSEEMKELTAASVKRDYIDGLAEDPEYAAVLLPAADRIDYSKFAGR